MRDAAEHALKKPCCSLEREMLNTTGALRVLVEKRAYLEIKSASGIPVTNGQYFPTPLFYQNPANGEVNGFCPFILFLKHTSQIFTIKKDAADGLFLIPSQSD